MIIYLEFFVRVDIIWGLHNTILIPITDHIETHQKHSSALREVDLIFLEFLINLVFLIETNFEMLRNLIDGNLIQDLLSISIPHVNQHICGYVTSTRFLIDVAIFNLKVAVLPTSSYL
jgi:hypothetical protein